MSDPAPPYKGLMMVEYSTHAPYGWGESLWINKPTYEASYAALEELAECRLALSPKTVRIAGLRVTNPHLPYASVFRTFGMEGKYETERTAVPWNTLQLRFVHMGYHTNYPLGGLPGGLANAAGIHLTDAWREAFDRYVEAIKRHCVMVNLKHLPRGVESNGERETVINPVQDVVIMRISSRKRGMGHSRPRGRRPKRK